LHTIAHIVNPFKASEASDLFVAQPITFESMLRAKSNAKEVVNVELWTACFEEDKSVAPSSFNNTPFLTRSVLDTFSFQKEMKLPLIGDILERLYASSQADYFIYTNVDIGLYPDFYVRVNALINEGYDACIINRRRLPEIYDSTEDLDRIYKDYGKSHPGFDCFVFSRKMFPKFQLSDVCIGVPFIGITLAQNVFCFANEYTIVEDENLTFHIGMEIYKKRAPRDYFKYNRKEFWKAMHLLKVEHHATKLPHANRALLVRLIQYGLNPSIPIRWVLFLEGQRYLKK
jgi:hypothetical protein